MSFTQTLKPKTAKAGDNSEIHVTSEHEACEFGDQIVSYDGQAEEPVIFSLVEKFYLCARVV